MRLFNTHTYQLEFFADWDQVPPYAILSHTWGADEVVYDDITTIPIDLELQQLHDKIEALRSKQSDTSPSVSATTPSLDIYTAFPHLRRAVKKASWTKIENFCNEAKKYGIKYVWVDTICIDKSSSAELSEAINSMWAWYRDAKVCFAYLEDVSPPSQTVELEEDENEDEVFEGEWDWGRPFEWSDELEVFATRIVSEYGRRQTSRWFTRGWTLQELIAPREIFFFYNDWSFVGTRAHLASPINRLTLIPMEVLQHRDKLDLNKYSVAERFLWASRRFTTKDEDRAYSLLGLMGVTLPIIYGEGYKSACYRLQVEIFKATADQSMFAWMACIRPWEAPESRNYDFFNANDTWDDEGEVGDTGLGHRFFCDLYAPAIEEFANAYDIVTKSQDIAVQPDSSLSTSPSRYIHGTPLQLPLQFVRELDLETYGRTREYIAFLACGPKDSDALCSIRVVNFASEPHRYYRILPSIEKTETMQRSEIDLASTEWDTMYLLSPTLDMVTPKSFQLRIKKRGEYSRRVYWHNINSILPDYKVQIDSNVSFMLGPDGVPTGAIIDTTDVVVVFWNSNSDVREGFICQVNYINRVASVVLKYISTDVAPDVVAIVEKGQIGPDKGSQELYDYLFPRKDVHQISSIPTIRLRSGMVIGASASYDEEDGFMRIDLLALGAGASK